MALPSQSEPVPTAVADLYRACHLAAPMVVVARDAVHFARLVKAWARANSPSPLVLTGTLATMLAVTGLGVARVLPTDFSVVMSAYLSLIVVPWFVWVARWDRGVRESLWWWLPRAGPAAIAGALTIWLGGRGLWEASPFVGPAMMFAASALIVAELLAPMRSRQDLCAAAQSTSGQANWCTWFRGAAPIGPMIGNRLGAALADVAPSTPTQRLGWDLARDPEPRVLRDALQHHWLRLWIPRQAEPVLGVAAGSLSSDWPLQVSALRLSGTDPAALPRLLQAAIRVDAVAAALSTFERVAVVLPSGSSPLLTAHLGGSASWRRSKRARWSAALHWLDEPRPTASLIDFAPADSIADWFLARRLAQVRDPAQRTPALKALGVDRAVASLRLQPVQEDAYGRLFQIGPREAPSVFLFVRDRVVDPDGSALTHWISVPPHVATAHEAVAWTFSMSDAAYHPTRET